MKLVEVPAAWNGLACIVREIDDSDLRLLFREDELAFAEAIARPKQRDAWLRSRAALKVVAMERKLVSSFLDCSALSMNEKPRPVVCGNAPAIHASLSHSDTLGAAALDFTPIGIDVEALERVVHVRTLRFYGRIEEVEIFHASFGDHALLALWTAKEAAFKATEVTTLTQISVAVEAGVIRWNAESTSGTVEVIDKEDHIVALARTAVPT